VPQELRIGSGEKIPSMLFEFLPQAPKSVEWVIEEEVHF
jgi:hypothetical protein